MGWFLLQVIVLKSFQSGDPHTGVELRYLEGWGLI